MKTRLTLILILCLPVGYQAAASPRQINNPAQRALEAQQQRNAQEQARREQMRPGLMLVSPSPNQVIGKVSRVNLARGFVVGWLHTRYLNLSGHIITRDEQLRTTAVLSLGSARNNRAAGLIIESGVPNIGDEIVVVTTAQQTLPRQASGVNTAQQAQGTNTAQQAAQQTQSANAAQHPYGANATQQTRSADAAQQAAQQTQSANAAQQTQAVNAAQQPPPSLRPRWQMPAAQQQPASAQQPANSQQQSEQTQLIPAQRMRNLSNAQPEIQTRITVTVE